MGFLKNYFIAIFAYVATLLLCLMPSSDIPKVSIPHLDKVFHFLMIIGLSVCTFFGDSEWLQKRRTLKRIFFSAFVLPALFGGFIEILQVIGGNGRTGDWTDFLFDIFGACMGFVICSLINKKIKTRKKFFCNPEENEGYCEKNE